MSLGDAGPQEVIAQLVAPVVMISASGLLTLALFNRLGTLVARVRTFDSERISLVRGMAGGGATLADSAVGHVRLEALEAQARAIIARARLVRNALSLLIASIMSMLITSVFIGLGLVHQAMSLVALATFALGLALMFGAMVYVLAELRRSLADVSMEHRVLEELGVPEASPREAGK